MCNKCKLSGPWLWWEGWTSGLNPDLVTGQRGRVWLWWGLAELGLWLQAGKNWPHHLLQTLINPHPIHSMAVTNHQSYRGDLA